MKVKLPNNNKNEIVIEEKSSIVLFGANGSGKTRMSVWIENNNKDVFVHRISAQKILNMPESIRPSDLELAHEKLLYGGNDKNKDWLKNKGKISRRWSNQPDTALLNDYVDLLEYLITEEFELSLEYRNQHKSGNKDFNNITKLEKIKKVWQNVLPHRKLEIKAGKILAYIEGQDKYNGSNMSDGERAIFYYIGEALSAPKNSIIIIDEPENHLHKSILMRLWNNIEIHRDDCIFIYITHDYDFALSRTNTQLIWVKEYNGTSWDYELLNQGNVPESLMIEVLGNRQKVILVEGTANNSIDIKLYSVLFEDFNIIPVGSCQSVIQFTKAFKKNRELHYVDVYGIVDRDRRNDKEVDILKEYNIFVPEVAEIENLFLIEEVIEEVMKELNYLDNDIDMKLQEIKENIFNFLESEKEYQALLFTKKKINNKIMSFLNNKVKTIEDYQLRIEKIKDEIVASNEHTNFINEIDKVLQDKDYNKALKIINNKGLIDESGLLTILGWKKDKYIEFVLRTTLKKNGERLKSIFQKWISIELDEQKVS